MSSANASERASEVLAAWKERAAGLGGRDTLLEFRETHDGSIDLTGAHPSGLAQLLAGRSTRLSSLIRDHDVLAEARRRARAIQSKADQLAAERALDAAHLAIGLATWRAAGQEQGEEFAAPVLLRRIALMPRGSGGNDFEFKLDREVTVNPALVRHLEDQHDLAVPAREWVQLTSAGHGFDAAPIYDRLRRLTERVPGFLVLPRLVVSTFADLCGPHLADPVPMDHPVIAGLAGDESARSGFAGEDVEPSGARHRSWTPLDFPSSGRGSISLTEMLQTDPEFAEAHAASRHPRPTPLVDRHPDDEFLIVDVDGDQQLVVDRALAGESMVVDTPPGTGATQVAVAAAAALAHAGRRVLFIAQDLDGLAAFGASMEESGELALVLDARGGPSAVRSALIAAITADERAVEPEVERLHAGHAELRTELAEHADSLHRIWDPWGVSVYDTMQHLAHLTSVQDGPETAIRLDERLLTMTKDELAGLKDSLLEYSGYGAFTQGPVETAWLGAEIGTAEEAERAQALAQEVGEELLPGLIEIMPALLRDADVAPEATVAGWDHALSVLMRIRTSLDKFSPEIYQHSLDDLVLATGSPRQRTEAGVSMRRSERSRLKSVAKDYIRPGAHVPELHEALAEVKSQRDEWRAIAQDPRSAPILPKGLAAAHSTLRSLRENLDELGPVLKGTVQGGDLHQAPVQELQERLQALGADRGSLDEVPMRSRLDRSLREAGLGGLMDDLRERSVAHERVADEFDLSWWASVLQAMAARDGAVGGHDGDRMHRAAAEFRLTDATVIERAASRLRWRFASRWKEAIGRHPEQAAVLKRALLGASPDLRSLMADAPDVLTALNPLWMMSPLHVAQQIPPGEHFDTVIIADAGRIGVPEALPSLSRAPQVIALGDDRLLGPSDFRVGADRRRDTYVGSGPAVETSVYGELAEFLPTRRLRTSYRASPPGLVGYANRHFYGHQIATLPLAQSQEGSGLEFSYVADGIGAPTTSTGQVDSPDAEVERVVQLVMRHARQHSRRSLAVVTLTQLHAQRIAAAIRTAIRDYPYVASFFSAGRAEPFVVTHCERIHGMARDVVIFSLGFGRTRHGRVIHKFGPLSQPGSERFLAATVTRARRRLEIVSSIGPADLDITRLSHGAALLPGLLREAASGPPHSDLGEPTEERNPLLFDIGERLMRRGVLAQEHYEGIDLAVANSPDEDRGMIVAVEGDGEAYVATRSIRERERRRPEQLARRGWRPVRVWSTDAFVDPEAEAGRIFDLWKETVEELSPQAVLEASRQAAQVLHRRGSRPQMRVGFPIHKCDPRDVDAMVDWIQSDQIARDDDELGEQLRRALAQKSRSDEVNRGIAAAVARYRERTGARNGTSPSPSAAAVPVEEAPQHSADTTPGGSASPEDTASPEDLAGDGDIALGAAAAHGHHAGGPELSAAAAERPGTAAGEAERELSPSEAFAAGAEVLLGRTRTPKPDAAASDRESAPVAPVDDGMDTSPDREPDAAPAGGGEAVAAPARADDLGAGATHSVGEESASEEDEVSGDSAPEGDARHERD